MHHRVVRFVRWSTVIAIVSLSVAGATAAPRDTYVVSTAWLAQHLQDPDLVLLHVGERPEYDAGHIPGARFVSTRDISVPPADKQSLLLEMPPAETLRAQLAALGISDRSHVVVYYGKDWVSPSTRVVFTLIYAGLQKVSLLDGGMPSWTKDGRTLTADAPPAVTGTLSALEIKPLIADAEFVRTHTNTAGFAVVDSRTASFYEGTQPGGPADRRTPGHIVGARSLPFTEIVTSDNTVKTDADLAGLFDKAGVKKGDTVITYCHIGQQATTTLFGALLLGYPVMLYDGSFEDWVRRDLPIENPVKK